MLKTIACGLAALSTHRRPTCLAAAFLHASVGLLKLTSLCWYLCRLAKTIHNQAVKAMVEPQEQEGATAIAADLAAAYELVCRARDCRTGLGCAMEVDGQQGAGAAADAAAVAGGIMEKILQLEAKVEKYWKRMWSAVLCCSCKLAENGDLSHQALKLHGWQLSLTFTKLIGACRKVLQPLALQCMHTA